MRRKVKDSPCRKFFAYDDINNLNYCKVPSCKVIMRGNHSTNLERHLQRFHLDEYVSVQVSKGHDTADVMQKIVDGKMNEDEASINDSPNKVDKGDAAEGDSEVSTPKQSRRKTNPCRKFFYFDQSSFINICNISGCGTIMKGDHAANLERHLLRHHPEQSAEIAQTKRKFKSADSSDYFEGGPNTLVEDGDLSQGKGRCENAIKIQKVKDENAPKMGRRRTNPCRKYYQYNPANNTNACIIPGCDVIMKGDHASNLERHLHSRHIEEYCEIQEEKKLNSVLKEDGMEYYNDVMQNIVEKNPETVPGEDSFLKTPRSRKTNPTRQFFEYDKLTNTNLCRMEGCGALMKGDHAANLERHLQSHHIEQYCEVQKLKQQRQEIMLSSKKDFLATHNDGSDIDENDFVDDDNEDDANGDSDNVPDHPHRVPLPPEYLDDNIVEINCETKRRGRPRTDPCRRFFIYDGATNTSHCRAENCDAILKGNNAVSLRKHLHNKHFEQYCRFQLLLNRISKQTKGKEPNKHKKRNSSSDNEDAAFTNDHSDRDMDFGIDVIDHELLDQKMVIGVNSHDVNNSSDTNVVLKREAEDSNSGDEAKRFCGDTGLDEDDELEIFGQYVVGQLKRLTGEDVWNTQEKIRAILRESCKKPALDKRK